MTYEEAIREAIDHFPEAIVITGGYDQEIGDHLNELEEHPYETEVYVEPDGVIYGKDYDATGWIIREIKADGYIDTGEALARIVSEEDYIKLGRG